jgi:ankyrin repeat protein
MPTKPLPDNPSLEHLKKQAKRLLDRLHASDPGARAEMEEFHPKPAAIADLPTLADAQVITARSYGFPTWIKLREFLGIIEPYVWNEPEATPESPADLFPRVACLTYARFRVNQAEGQRLLAANPDLASTSIYLSAAIGDVEQTRTFLDRDPQLLNRKGGPFHWEPLLYACYSRFTSPNPAHSLLEVVRSLLERGADPNAGFLHSGTYPFTALTGAFGRGEDWNNQPPHAQWRELVKLLLDHGADPNDLQSLYNRHFDGNNEHLQILLSYGFGKGKDGPWFARMQGGTSPANLAEKELIRAAQKGFLERVRLLVEHGVNVNARLGLNGRTVYEEALRAGRTVVADYLLQHGAAKVELDTLQQFSIACAAGRRDEVQARLKADPTLLERLGHNGRIELLHRAGHILEGIRLAVELGVDINAVVPGTHMDRTVLHNAAAWSTIPVIKFLLDLGADPNLLDLTYHSTPVGWALYHGRRDNAEFLLPFTGVADAIRCGSVERIIKLLDQDPSQINATDSAGNPLSFVVTPMMANLHAVVGLLTQRGLNWTAKNTEGETALDRAVGMGWSDLADVIRQQLPEVH